MAAVKFAGRINLFSHPHPMTLKTKSVTDYKNVEYTCSHFDLSRKIFNHFVGEAINLTFILLEVLRSFTFPPTKEAHFKAEFI